VNAWVRRIPERCDMADLHRVLRRRRCRFAVRHLQEG
jgi:hypothetical protein